MGRYLWQGIVILVDDDPRSHQLPQRALDNWEHVHVLADMGATDLPDGVEVTRPSRGDATLDGAFRLARDQTVPWVGIRRDLAPPEDLLVQLLECTGRHATEDTPGFAALMMGASARPVDRILTIINRADGDPSGLMTLMAVAAATGAHAQLDVLVLGAPGESLDGRGRTVDEMFHVTRDKDFYEQAKRRADEAGLRPNWIVIDNVTDPVSIALDQISAEDYGLVLKDLGDLKFGGRVGRGKRLADAVGPDGPGAIPNAILARTDVQLLLVLDAVRLGLVSSTVVRASAVALLGLGTLGVAVPAAGAITTSNAQATSVSQTVSDYETALEQAVHGAAPQTVAMSQAQAQDSAETVTGDGDVSTTRAAAAEGAGQAPSADQGADTGGADSTESLETGSLDPSAVTPDEAEAVTVDDSAVDTDSVTPEDAQAAQDDADASKQDLADAQEAFDAAQHEAVDAKEDAEDAAAHAAAAEDELASAQASYDETFASTDPTIHSGTGLSSMVPGGASDADVATAQQARADASDDLADAVQASDDALTTYQDEASQANATYATLDEAAAQVSEADADYQVAAATADAEHEAVASQRQAPVQGVDIGTAYGVSGPMWSTGYHTGSDYPVPVGTEVDAAASGTVIDVTHNDPSYGNRVVIQHDDGYETTYNHLSETDVEVGQEVTVGDQIGLSGATGNVSGPHLHFEVAQGGDGWGSGSFVDPSAWLAGQI